MYILGRKGKASKDVLPLQGYMYDSVLIKRGQLVYLDNIKVMFESVLSVVNEEITWSILQNLVSVNPGER